MTLSELKNKVEIGTCVNGHFKVTIMYRGKKYTCTSTDTLAYDVARAWLKEDDTLGTSYYTPKQAYQALYDEVKSYHNL